MTARNCMLLVVVVLAGCASGPDISDVEAAKVRVVTAADMVRGCEMLGTVADNALDDLQRKAARLGGNTALLTPDRKFKGGWFGVEDYKTADVYRCGGTQ